MNATLIEFPETTSTTGYFTLYYVELAAFLENTDQALLIQQIHYWLQNGNAGYILKDGRRWIYNGYLDWIEQLFPWKSVSSISRMVTDLEQRGWIITKRFYECKHEIGFIGKPPTSFQEDNQRKWYQLDYQQIFEDTGLDLLYSKGSERQKPKRSRRANLQKCNLEFAQLQIPICNCANTSIYIDHQINNHISHDQKEIVDSVVDESQESPNESTVDTTTSATCQEVTQQIELEEVNSQVQEPPVQINIPRRRSTKLNKRQKFEWEVEVNRPHNDFVSWRANTHYTPQGSHWAAGAVSNAFSEIVNKSNNCPEKAQALWEQFLEYAKRSADNAQERINNGMEAWLPSCFEQQPQLDAQQVGQELLAVKQQIQQQEQAKALPAPQPQQQEVLENQPLTLEQRVKNRQLMWNSGGAVIRQVIVEWVKETPGVVMTPNGPALEADVQPEVDSAATNPSTTANPHQDAGTAAAPRRPKSLTLAEQVSCRRLVWASPSVAPEVRQQIQLWAENTPGVVMTPDGPALE